MVVKGKTRARLKTDCVIGSALGNVQLLSFFFQSSQNTWGKLSIASYADKQQRHNKGYVTSPCHTQHVMPEIPKIALCLESDVMNWGVKHLYIPSVCLPPPHRPESGMKPQICTGFTPLVPTHLICWGLNPRPGASGQVLYRWLSWPLALPNFKRIKWKIISIWPSLKSVRLFFNRVAGGIWAFVPSLCSCV